MTSTTKTDRRIASPLRLRYPLQPREAATGFASRLAAVNGRHLSELLRHRNLSPWDVDRGDPDAIRFVAAIGSADPDRLLHQTIRPAGGDRRWEVAGESFGPNGVNRTYFRYCPHCMLEDMQKVTHGPIAAGPWLRIEWTLNHYMACHRHHAFLVAAEPTRRRFAPFDFNETAGRLAPQLKDIAASTEPYRASPYHDWIVARLDGRRDPDNWLDTLSLHAGAAWCESLGISSLHPPKIPPGQLSRLDRAIAADEGFRIASAGEDAIRSVLDRLTNAQKRTRGIVGPRDTYGYAFGLLQKTMDEEAFEPLRKLVRDYVMNALPWKIGTDMLGVTIEQNAVLTVQTAALASGTDRKTIRKIFRRRGLAVEDLDDGRVRDHRVMVPVQVFEDAARKLRRALSVPQAMKRLGIDRRQLNAIVEAGALPDASGAAPDFGGHARYAPEDIDAMLARLMNGAVEVTAPGPRQVDIPTARHMAGATTVEVLKLVFGDRLAWKGRVAGRTDYMGLLLDADEVTRLVRRDSVQFSNLRFCDVATVIPGINERSVQPLIDLEKLVKSQEWSPNARRDVVVVTRQSAEAFHQEYVTAGELCQAHGLHHKQVKSILIAAGIPMAFVQDQVHAMIYDRAKVERAAAGRQGFWHFQK